MTDFRIGVDIGGTFTDIVFLGNDGRVLTRKVASTPDDYSRAVLDGIRDGIDELRIDPASVTEVGHGFTVATNAIIEEKGAHMALITTEGFRDVLGVPPQPNPAPLRSLLREVPDPRKTSVPAGGGRAPQLPRRGSPPPGHRFC